jgi:hypothetical protein
MLFPHFHPFCSLCSQLADGVVRAQTWLKGCVILRMSDSTAIKAQYPQSLTVQVVGEELTTISRRLGSTASAKHVVFDEMIVVHGFADEVSLASSSGGQFPFSLFLPADVPPSMHYEDRHGSCKVQFFVIAKLGNHVPESCRLTVVGKPLSSKNYPFRVEPTCLPLKTMAGTVDHGCIVLAAKLDNCHVAKGRKAEFSISCRNKSKENIERFDVQVLEQIWWQAGGSEHTESVKLDSYCDVDIPGLKSSMPANPSNDHQHLNQRPQISAVENSLAHEVAVAMQEELQAKSRELSVQIPSRAFDSYNGTLVRVTHSIRILAFTKQHNHRDPEHAPSISLPVEVFDPPMEAKSMRDRSIVHEHAVQAVATTVWPKDEDPLCAKENRSSPSVAHRKIHSDTEFSYDSIMEVGEQSDAKI